jgi:imidazolonepropionase-like amidohydrolase
MRLYPILKIFFTASLIAFFTQTFSQENIPENGVRDERNIKYCFQNATIHVNSLRTIQNGTLIILNDKIIYSGESKASPKDAVVEDLKGKHIYPSFIDLYSSFGMPKEVKSKPKRGPQIEGTRKGPNNWNDAIRSDVQAYRLFENDSKKAEKILASGFGIVLSSQNDGIARGTSVLLALDPGTTNECIIDEETTEGYSFSKGSSKQDYPNSLLGSVALIRQTLLDAQWYEKNKSKLDFDASLEAINRNKDKRKIFFSGNKLNSIRADRIGNEFGIQFVFVGNGDEYQSLREVKKTGAAFILPLNFPKTMDLSDPLIARNTNLNELMHWELAPANPYYLDQAGIKVMFTLNDLKKEADFLPAIQKAVEYGLSRESALKGLTSTPAMILGREKELGVLIKGARANFFLSSKDIFEKGTAITTHWINGKKVILKKEPGKDVAGTYRLKYDSENNKVILGKGGKKSILVFESDSIKLPAKGTYTDNEIGFSIDRKKDGIFRFSGWSSEKGFKGKFLSPDGSEGEFSLSLGAEEGEEKKEKAGKVDKVELPGVDELPYPFGPYGLRKDIVSEEFVVKNARVWTNTEKGILETDVWVKNGKIYKIGKGLVVPKGVTQIDGKGKHLSSGIIDEHSHIALNSVNEGGQNSTAEVRMMDAINPENIHIYRQLAGGVTAAQLLHGSANPVGGQSAIIKFRWGSSADELLIKDAPGFIKFALGENVKQSNWGDLQNKRFPQSRMGVEQVYDDLFQRAGEYGEKWKTYNSLSSKEKRTKIQPRRDLELETILEIMNKERFITCHSYVQSEINMLMKVAERYNFRINTFTHILEGYKVADIMKEHGAGASSFSDWWAYKFEVKDAIPQNPAIMTKAGVTTAVNSDNSEMARRLNQEAAKSVKYGDISEEEAWKMVTLNPAKLLHLDHRMGMVKEGYDADLVLWDKNPLSVYARVEKTFVEGSLMYSVEIDLKNRVWIKSERNRIVQKMLKEKKKKPNGPFGKPTKKENEEIGCESKGNFDF